MKRKFIWLSSTALLLLIWASLNVGIVKLHSVLGLIFNHGNVDEVTIMQEIRGPRILAALLVGAALGVGGALSQGALKNPLAEPVILGTSGGAALATLLGILIFGIEIGTPVAISFGILGALIATFSTYRLGREGKDGISFVIMGIAVSATLIAIVGIASVMIAKPEAKGVTFWSLGTLSMTTRSQSEILLPILIATTFAAIKLAPNLDYLALGDLRAKHLGINVSKIRFQIFLVIAISIGAVTATFGQISFLALAIPHILRAIIGHRHKPLVIHSALLGASLLLFADLATRTLAAPNELPLGLMTAIFGAPVLIIAARKKAANA